MAIYGQSIYVDGIQPLLLSSIPIAPACEMDTEIDTFSSNEQSFSQHVRNRTRNYEVFFFDLLRDG